AVLERFDSPDVEAHGRVELERPPAGRGFGRVVDDVVVYEIGVATLDLEVEARPIPCSGRLRHLREHLHRHCLQRGARLQTRAVEMRVAGIRVPGEATTEIRMELVPHRRVHEWCDPLVKRTSPVTTEQETAACHGRATHAELLAPSRQQLTMVSRKTLRADLRLPVAPSGVGAAE